MQQFGPTFKIIRENKGFKLKEVAQGIVTIPTLSSFENGRSDIKLTNFTLLLTRINMTFDEFFSFYKSDEVVNINALIKDFTDANNHNYDKFKLLKMSQNYLEKYKLYHRDAYLHMSILCEVYSVNAPRVEPHKHKVIKDYLASVEVWGKYEIFLFHCCSQIYTPNELNTIRPFFLNSVDQYHKDTEINKHEVLLNQALVSFLQEDLESCDLLIQTFYKTPPTDFVQVGYFLFAQFLEGLVHIAHGEPIGRDKCNGLLNQLQYYDQFLQVRNQLSYWIERAVDISNQFDSSRL